MPDLDADKEKALRRINSLSAEFVATEGTFTSGLTDFVRYIDSILPTMRKADSEKVNFYIQPYRDIINANITPGTTPDITPDQSSEEKGLLTAQRVFSSMVKVENGNPQLTDSAAKMFAALSKAVVNYEAFDELINSLPAFKKPTGLSMPLASYAIMPVQRGPRYQMLMEEMKKTLDNVIPGNDFQKQLDFLKTNIADINKNKASYQDIANNAANNAALGHMAGAGVKLLDLAKERGANENQLQTINQFLNNVENISNVQGALVTQKALYEQSLLAFTELYLSHDTGNKKDVLSAMLEYLSSVDKNLKDNHFPTLIFKSKDKIAPSTVFKTLAKSDPAIRDNIVNALFTSLKERLQNPMAGNDSDKLAFKRALKAVNEMGSQAQTAWNDLAKVNFPALAVPNKLKFEDVLKQVVRTARQRAPSLFVQVMQPVDRPEAKEYSENTAKEAAGIIAAQIAANAKAIKKYSPQQQQIWNDFSVKMLDLLKTLPADGKLPSAQLYTVAMDAFTQGFMLHKKGDKDIFEGVIRNALKNIDTALQQIGLEGIVYKTAADLPGKTNKDAAALKSIAEHPEYGEEKINELFTQFKVAYEKPLTDQTQKDAAHSRTVEAITAMGAVAVQQWNTLAGADKNLSDKVIPVVMTTPDQPDLASTTKLEDSAVASEASVSRRASLSPTSPPPASENDVPSPPPVIPDDDAPPLLSSLRGRSPSGTSDTTPPPSAPPSPTSTSRRGPPPLPTSNATTTDGTVPPAPPSPTSTSRRTPPPLPPLNSTTTANSVPTAPPIGDFKLYTPKPAAAPAASDTKTNTATPVTDNTIPVPPPLGDFKPYIPKPPAPPIPPAPASTLHPPGTTPIPTAPPLGDTKPPAPPIPPAPASTLHPPGTTPIPTAPPLGDTKPPAPPIPPAPESTLHPPGTTPIPTAPPLGDFKPYIPKPPAPPIPPAPASTLHPPGTTPIPTAPPLGDFKPYIPKPPAPPIPPAPASTLHPPGTTPLPPAPAKPGASDVLDPELLKPLISHTIRKPTPASGTNTTSSIRTTLPIVTSTRDHGFLDENKIKKMEPILRAEGWDLSPLKTVNNESVREATKASDPDRKFTISQQEIKTSDTELETFKTMLKCYQASNNVLPAISVPSEELKEKWIQAFREVYPTKAAEARKLITLQGQAPSPDPDQTPSMRPR